jgi:hypothetical protein
MRYKKNYNKIQKCKLELFFKNFYYSNYFLQPENIKKKSLVIVNQHVTVNLYLNLAQTARHAFEVGLRKKNKFIIYSCYH